MTARLWTVFGVACACALSGVAHANVETEGQLIFENVLRSNPDKGKLCPTDGTVEDRVKHIKGIVIKEVMPLMESRRIKDPFPAGMKAGEKVREFCGYQSASTVGMKDVRWHTSLPPLVVDPVQRHLGFFTSEHSMANRVFTPEAPGPFPAVVISHTKGISPHLLVHAKELISAGFAVVIVDTYGPRNIANNASSVTPAESAKDAYAALAALQQLAYIKRDRIYQTGYSLGGYASAMLASPEGARQFNSSYRFRATVANYASCGLGGAFSGAIGSKIQTLSEDSDRPLLMLMAEQDIEAPPSLCFPLLEEMKKQGKPVEWHVYPNTTHAWDKAEHQGHVFQLNSGETMTYRYDAAVTADATRRMIEFFNLHQ